jgi:hypothetical protein
MPSLKQNLGLISELQPIDRQNGITFYNLTVFWAGLQLPGGNLRLGLKP